MHRFFVPSRLTDAVQVDLDEGEARHAVQVLRLRSGDPVELLDGFGHIAEGILEECSKREARVRIVRQWTADPPRIPVHLYAALLKGRGLDLVLEKCVELGASSLTWMDTAHCVSRLAADEIPRKQATWHHSLVEAAKQSRNPWLPELRGPFGLPRILDELRSAGGVALLASLRSGSQPVSRVLEERFRHGGQVPSIRLLVGPEGDFTESEEERLIEAGAVRVSLGSNILRAETAAISLLAVATNHARR